MAIKSLSEKMLEHQPSNNAESLFESIMALKDENGNVSLAGLMAVIRGNVGFNKSNYKEVIYTLYFASEDKAPVWLGGDELPSLIESTATARAVTQPVSPKAQEPSWARFG